MESFHFATDVERLMESLGQLPEPATNPVLVAVSGLPGTGKSYFSAKLAEKLPFVILESDTLRKVLFSPPAYTARESAYLFQAIHSLIERLLKKGISLILDATNLSEAHREELDHIAEKLDAKLVIVRVEAPPEIVQARLRARVGNRYSQSDADWSVYKKMKPYVEEIRRKHYAVDTSRDIAPVLKKIAREVRR